MNERSVLVFLACLLLGMPVIPGAGSQALPVQAGRIFSPPAADKDGKITVLVYYDM